MIIALKFYLNPCLAIMHKYAKEKTKNTRYFIQWNRDIYKSRFKDTLLYCRYIITLMQELLNREFINRLIFVRTYIFQISFYHYCEN